MTGWTDGAAEASYRYYPDNMRRRKTVDGDRTQHVWVGSEIALDITENETISYIAGIKSTYGWHVYNAHGDVVQLCDDNGNVIRTYDYDPFGNQMQDVDSTDANPYRYCGEYYDIESGYTYLRARYYDPEIGRFISEDPAMDGYNWYVYCGNNPIMYHDPTGTVIEFYPAPRRYDYTTGKEYIAAQRKYDEEKTEYERAVNYLMGSTTFADLYNKLDSAEEVFTISINRNVRLSSSYNSSTREISWTYLGGLVMNDKMSDMSPAMSLAQEMGHAAQHLDGEFDKFYVSAQRREDKIEADNLKKHENPIAKQLGEPMRPSYKSHNGPQGMNNSIHYKTKHTGVKWGWLAPYVKNHNQSPIIGLTISAAS
jgi:RHS repeat-associated protein